MPAITLTPEKIKKFLVPAGKITVGQFLLKEHNNLDLIRIICASMVIIGHAYVLNPPGGQQDLVRMLTGFTYSGAVAVKIFFFVSGLLVTNSLLRKQSVPGFLISRLFRMMPGLILVLLVTILVIGPLASELGARHYFTNRATYTYFIGNLVFNTRYLLPGVFLKNYYPGAVNGSLWSLQYEVFCYIGLLFVFLFSKLIFKKTKLVFSLVILFIFLDALFRTGVISRGTNTEISLLPVSFAFGSLLAVNKDYIAADYKLLIIPFLLSVISWRTHYYNELFFMIFVFLCVIVISRNKYVKGIKIKHDISYGVYLWGFLVQQCINCLLGNQNVYLFMILSLVTSIVMGYLSFVLVEQRFVAYGRKLDNKLARRPVVR